MQYILYLLFTFLQRERKWLGKKNEIMSQEMLEAIILSLIFVPVCIVGSIV